MVICRVFPTNSAFVWVGNIMTPVLSHLPLETALEEPEVEDPAVSSEAMPSS